MAQFTLTWDNTDVLANANVINQRALYRKKDTGGAFLDTDFSPANDLPTSAITVDSVDGLDDNSVYQFKVQSICTSGGPTDNDNGIKDMITFACIEPELDQTEEEATATVDLTGTNITKVRFTLKRSIDDVIVAGPTIVNKIGDEATLTATGLVAETDYYWELELYATLNTIEVISSNVAFLGTVCGPYPFATDASPICEAITSVTVVAAPL